MKNFVWFLTICFACFSFTLNAQVFEEERSMSLGINNAIVIEIPGTTDNFVEKQWKKYSKEFGGKTKKNKKSNETFTDDAKIVSIGGTDLIDLYARVENSGNNAVMMLWIDKGSGFVSSVDSPRSYQETEKLLLRFALEVAKEMTRLELETQEKSLKKLVTNQKRLEKDNARFHKEIEVAKGRIAKAESDIEQNLKDQEDSQDNIKIQMDLIEDVKKKLEDLDN